MKTRKLIIFLLPILFGSCQKIISDFDVPEKPVKLVLHGKAVEDSAFRINVSRSLNFYDKEEFIPVSVASLTLLLNGQELGSFQYDSLGWYTNSGVDFSQTGEYVLLASAPGYPEATARFSIPEKPDVRSVPALIDEVVTPNEYSEYDFYDYYMDAEIRFRDDPDETNFYMLRVLHRSYDYAYYEPADPSREEISIAWKPLYLQAPSGLSVEVTSSYEYYELANLQEATHSGEVFFLNDSQFDGVDDVFDFKAELASILYNDLDSADGKYTVIVEFSEIDRNYFEYAKNRAATSAANDNPFAEPVTVYQSIENGFGLVYGYNSFRDTIHLLELEGPDISEIDPRWDYYY